MNSTRNPGFIQVKDTFTLAPLNPLFSDHHGQRHALPHLGRQLPDRRGNGRTAGAGPHGPRRHRHRLRAG